jgi:hypothetical protein
MLPNMNLYWYFLEDKGRACSDREASKTACTQEEYQHDDGECPSILFALRFGILKKVHTHDSSSWSVSLQFRAQARCWVVPCVNMRPLLSRECDVMFVVRSVQASAFFPCLSCIQLYIIILPPATSADIDYLRPQVFRHYESSEK